MGSLIEMTAWCERKKAQIEQAPALPCPTCEIECKAVSTAGDGSVLYRCSGHGHRPLSWRIDAEGNMLRGAVGRRYY